MNDQPSTLKCELEQYTSMATGGYSRGWRRSGTHLGTMVAGHKKARHGKKKRLLQGTENGGSVAASASAQGRSKHGTAKEAGGMAVKTAEQVLAPKPKVVSKEHFGELQRIPRGKTSSLRKTYKTQSEANDKVWMLNENTEGVGHVGHVFKALRGSQQGPLRH